MAKKPKINLSIPSPCKEDWNKMTPGERGRFCSHCSKSIIDFSKYTDRELLAFFTKTTGQICGRVSNHQLNRLIVVSEPSSIPIFRKLLWGAALTAGVAGAAQGQSNATTIGHTNKTIDSGTKANQKNFPKDSTFQIKGIVIDSATKQPLPFVPVILENNDGLQISDNITDGEGKFELNITKNLPGKKLTIRTQMLGFHDYMKTINITNYYIQPITIVMSPAEDEDTATINVTMGLILIDRKDSAKLK